MDPDVAWARMFDPRLSTGEKIDAGLVLLNWLNRGGFPPRELGPREALSAVYHRIAVLYGQEES